MANGIKYYAITEETLMKFANLKAASCGNLDGNIGASTKYFFNLSLRILIYLFML